MIIFNEYPSKLKLNIILRQELKDIIKNPVNP
jgi:hypothetical protein